MESRSIAYNPTFAPGMGGMMPGMQDMQGMQGMPEMMHGVPGHLECDPCFPPQCPPVMEQYSPAPIPTPTPAHQVYVVKKGDSVYKIAQRYGMTMQAIITANNLQNPHLIYPGQILIIPSA